MLGRQPGRSTRNEKGTKENLVVLKAEKEYKKDNGKRCDYCIVKGWKGLNHTKSECYIKKREKKKEGKTKKTKGKGDSDDESEDGVTICYVKVKGAHAIEPKNHFEYDSATSHYRTNHMDLLQDIQDIAMTVEAYNKLTSVCHKKGTLVFVRNGQTHYLQDCLYDPTYSNLISEQRHTAYTLEAEPTKATLKEGGKTVYTMKVDSKGAIWIKIEKPASVKVTGTESTKELHERYGHISFDTLRTLPECHKFNTKLRYEAYKKGKATKPVAKSNKEPIRTFRPLERLHTDLVGSIKPVTPTTQYKYLLVVTDDFSLYIVTKAIYIKNDTVGGLIEIINALEKAVSHQVSQIQAEWVDEFTHKELTIELKQRGITLKETVPQHSETIAIAERANRTILTMSRTAILGAELPK